MKLFYVPDDLHTSYPIGLISFNTDWDLLL